MKRTYVAFGITLLFLGTCIIPSAPSEPTQGTRIITVDDEPGDADFTSVKEAVNASYPGDTIEVYSGIYYEGEIRITKENVSLLGISHELGGGNDSDKPFIKGIFGDGTETADIIQLVASHVTVSNCYIQNLGLEISDYYSCVRIGDEVEDSSIEGCSISDCIVSRSIIGIFCHHVGPLDSTTISNNRVFGCQSFGMLMESDNDTTTEGDFTISRNVILDCTIGIYLKSDRENVSGNSIRLCDFGITLHGNQNIIFGNDFDNCSVGVCDYDLPAHDNVITKNNFKSYSRGKLWWAKPPSFLLTILNIFGNKEWKQNYWDTWRGVGPKVVPGGFVLGEKEIPIIWFNLDWRPAKEPYDIP